MTNSTTEYWSVDGVSLQTFAFDIETVGGDRLAPPKLRGSDLTIPSQPGDVWVPKEADSRTITLDMWVLGTNDDGTIPTGTVREKWDANFRMLRTLLWTPRRQFTLTKRFYVDGVLKTATAKGEYAGGLSPKMTGRTRGEFSVDIRLADPYFYSAAKSVTLSTGDNNVVVEGDDLTRNILIHVDGPRKNVKIRNKTLGVEVEYLGDLSTGDDLDIDVRAFTSTTSPSSLYPFNSIGSIRHAGSPSWLLLAPGTNVVNVSSETGIGSVSMSYQEAWL